MEYGWIQVTQLARLFVNKLPSWIRLSQDEEYRVRLYRQILESDQVSVCHEASYVNLAYLTFLPHASIDQSQYLGKDQVLRSSQRTPI